MNNNSNKLLCISALLISLGIVIPIFSPFRLIIEPASFTLASHVTIFISMFISPKIATSVTIGTTVGFFLGGFPLIVALRASSHIVFVYLGSLYLYNFPTIKSSNIKLRLFSFSVALIHAVCEIIVVSIFYYGDNISEIYYEQGFLVSVMLLVGVGTIIHSLIDFEIAYSIIKVLQLQNLKLVLDKNKNNKK